MYRDGFPAPLATSRESSTHHVSIAWFQCCPDRFITTDRTTLIHVFTMKVEQTFYDVRWQPLDALPIHDS